MLEGGKSEKSPHCTLSAKALYPSFSICGVRNECLSQVQAWRQLHLDELEYMLAEAETKEDIGLSNYCHDLFGLGGKPIQSFSSPFKILFGKGTIAAKPTVFELVVSSCSNLPVSWKIRLWNDKEVDLEKWVEDLEPADEDEQLYMNVREQELISVSPSDGFLEPKETAHINFTYKHIVEGMHVLPAILQFEHGHGLPLMLCGETLPRATSILVLESSSFKLKSVAIGNVNPPLQTFELRNDGISQLEYIVDLTPLTQLQEENYDFQILTCLNPSGSIPPNETLLLNWYFRPIETKTYSVDMFISVMNGEGARLSIEGSHLMMKKISINSEVFIFIIYS